VTLGALALLAFGLAMDAAAVSAARGVACAVVRPRHVVMVAAFFGGAQALMPAVGWAIGARVGGYVAAWAPWLAGALLLVLGVKMLREARARPEDVEADGRDPWGLGVMAALAVATSVDALAVGFTLPMLGAALAPAVAMIGGVTAVTSAAALLAGRRLGALLGPRLDAAGGLVLVALGVRLLWSRALG